MNKERQECQIYSRVNGWYTPTKCYNKGKVSEYKDRKEYIINYNKLDEDV